ncbi:carbonic anhydrase family protein [Ideonella alba]|uniref:Carbonic anhydrase family protein n=1 Tax=Ideonella alba TaxID=2824118 RepID=A0A940YH71_9BURK|nr:carbonic anhydrase family protein [Ideonella alba]MBQ0932397.1 carbonic anhydrase family protein [Ideonella alba]
MHHLTRRQALASLGLLPLTAQADLCRDGRRQSPIDIVPTAQVPLPPLRADWQPSPLRWVHDGHTLRVRSAPGSRLWVGAVPHTLQQFHFHLPGGDRIRGESFPLGLHFPHKSPSGQLVTLVLLCREGAPHPALAQLPLPWPRAGQPEQRVDGASVDPRRWLPTDLAYYRYEGSLTSAPCTEGVVWLVLKAVATVSAAQLSALRAVMAPNARAVQPSNGRAVLAS